MKTITEDVQVVVNHDAVKFADSKQNLELKQILHELKSVETSVPEEDLTVMSFTNNGGPQHNYVHTGGGAYHVNSGSEEQYIGESQNFVIEPEEDFRFCGPAGIFLGQAPYIAKEFFVGRDKEPKQILQTVQSLDESQEQRRLVLGSMGGVGKTQLTIAYVRSQTYHQNYGAVFWLNAES
ncbi:uncharacterized protein BDW70DRAFT_81352 [Aspergillus foveolatus]|uniref:uncharacterized protein n=1 Tax=Aspergillus foveolatus TaxID=210207 RepID=UPI003CCD3ABF